MNPYKQIELSKDDFTKKELIVYELLHQNPDIVLRGSVAELSSKYNVSQSTITRFCQKIGYKGFNEFKYDVFRFEKIAKLESNDNFSSLGEYINLIQILDNTLDLNKLKILAKAIISADTVYLTGIHKSNLPAQMLQINLTKMKIKSVCLNSDNTHDYLQLLNSEDLVITFTCNGNGIKSMGLDYSEYNFNTAIITMTDELEVKPFVDYYCTLPSSFNQRFDTYLENQIMFFLFVDILTSQIATIQE